jgi:curved DNA-binding protein CbpA
MQKNYYKILQIDPSAEPEVISAAYKRLSLKYHPDTNRSADANLRMQEINEAYQVIQDPARRAGYDRYLTSSQTASSANGENGGHRANATPPYPQTGLHSSRPSRPRQALAGTIGSLSFPVIYILLIFILFRFFRSPSIITSLVVMILAGIIAYRVSSRVEGFFR